VELRGLEPLSFDLASEASPGAAGGLMSGPRRAPARSANPSLIDVPLGTQALPRGEARFTTPRPQRRHLRGDGYLVLARQQVRHCRHLYFFPTFDGDPGTPARFFRLDRSKSKPCSPICVFQGLHCTSPSERPFVVAQFPGTGGGGGGGLGVCAVRSGGMIEASARTSASGSSALNVSMVTGTASTNEKTISGRPPGTS
jgi:hypothetical protein